METLAAELRSVIDRRGLIGAEAGEELGVSQATVSRWLSGLPPDDERAPDPAGFLDCAEADVERLIVRVRRAQREGRRQTAEADKERRGTEASMEDDDIELDFKSTMRHVPEEVCQAVIRIVKPYLEPGT